MLASRITTTFGLKELPCGQPCSHPHVTQLAEKKKELVVTGDRQSSLYKNALGEGAPTLVPW
jgi:hypothetical protein